jgi:hypothetical protein
MQDPFPSLQDPLPSLQDPFPSLQKGFDLIVVMIVYQLRSPDSKMKNK